MRELKIRLLQLLALYAPGSTTVRPWLHRRRGVDIGEGVFIGTDSLIETSKPQLVSIRNGVIVGIRTTIIAHFFGQTAAERGESGARFSVVIEDEAFIGPNVTILPGVTIGRGAVVAAGSVVTSSVPPLTLVQGNPARPLARCGFPLKPQIPLAEFYKALRPIRAGAHGRGRTGTAQSRPGESQP